MTRPDRCACLLIIPRCSGCPAAGRARCAGTRPVPVLTWLVAFWVCRWLRGTQAHPATPTAGVRLRRTASGGYQTIRLDPGSSRTHVE
jgi:hypothetical protein